MDDDLPFGRELDAVANQVDNDLPKPGDISLHSSLDAIVHLVRQLESLLGGFCREQVQGILDAVPQIKRCFLQVQLPGFDLREVQDVVDDGEKRFAAVVDSLRVSLLFVRKGSLEQQSRHGDDAVHRSANLMAHVGQELGLGAGGRFGINPGSQEFPVHLRELELQVPGFEGSTDSGPQFGAFKGLSEVIRSAQFQAVHLVGGAIPGGQNYYRETLGFRRGLDVSE